MKKIIALFAVLSLMTAIYANAQKLPEIQTTSLYVPATIRVDGKVTEWNSQFQAYNKSTEISYTISNDNDKLYLAVQATDLDIINKIICAGITLTINGTGKMKDQGGVAITFPVLYEDSFPRNPRGESYSGVPINLDKPASWSADSFMVVMNKDLASKAKYIKVIGVKEITNSLISIYNPEGIKAAALFDNKTIFTYELAVPLKYLGLSINNSKPFAYNIKLRGMNPDVTDRQSIGEAIAVQRGEILSKIMRGFISNDPNKMPSPEVPGWESIVPVTYPLNDGAFVIKGPNSARVKNLITPTDFWGEYTLAK